MLTLQPSLVSSTLDTMLTNPEDKYKAFPPVHLPHRRWPDKTLKKPPRWLSTDLRDGNQALVNPMDGDAKLRYFEALLKLGYKEIEVSYPSASQTEFDFTRRLITTGAIPDDVTIQVMAPCREDLILTTLKAARGAKKVIVHIHMSTSACFREVVFNMSKGETIARAVRCAQVIREATRLSPDAEMRQTEWTLEFTPENFQDTSLDFALEICEAVKAVWQPSQENPVIFNLAATVEVAMPNVFADQIEYFCTHISERDKVCVSLHNHNDRGSAVAATEMAQLAGADRVEGCLFGNGERTGNVDLVTLAMNLYTQGVHPGIDFGSINDIIRMVEELTQVPVHARAPYAGKFTFCTFTGTHQDAIRKGYTTRAKVLQSQPTTAQWRMPYLPMDPEDLGREHEAIIRINAQSGKGGIGWLIKDVLGGVELPRDLEIAFTRVVKRHANDTGSEVTHSVIDALFRKEYMPTGTTALEIVRCDCSVEDVAQLGATIAIDGVQQDLHAVGTDLMSSIIQAVKPLCPSGAGFTLRNHHVQRQPVRGRVNSAVFVELEAGKAHGCWGVGIHEDAVWASLAAVLGAVINMWRDTGSPDRAGAGKDDAGRGPEGNGSAGAGKDSDDRWVCVCSFGCDGA